MRLLIIILCFCAHFTCMSSPRAFTMHNKGKIVKLYLLPSLRETRIAVYPYKAEYNAGIEVEIVGVVGNALQIKIGDEILYCHKGNLAVNTRNYDGAEFILYKSPDKDSKVSGRSSREQTVCIYNVSHGWLFVKGEDDRGNPIEGWLPPEMQCSSLWTPCN